MEHGAHATDPDLLTLLRPLRAIALALVAPAAADEPPARYRGEPFHEAFRFHLGEWLPAPDEALLARQPELASMVAFADDWGANDGLLRVDEGLPGGDRTKSVLEGTIA